jgi:hypothetical protein
VHLVQLLLRHRLQQLRQLPYRPLRNPLSLVLLFFRLRREEGLVTGRRDVGLLSLLLLLAVVFRLDRWAASLFVDGRRLGDFAGGLTRQKGTLPSCFCLM